MQLRCLRDERQLTVSASNTLGKGGEAQVYAVDRDALWTLGPSLAAKVYAPGKEREERALKLLLMRDHPPTLPNGPDGHTPVAWPIDLLCDRSGIVVGFLMPRVQNARQIIDFYNPRTRLEHCPLFDYRYLLRTARNLAAAVRVLHARGYVIGDLKHSNVLVTNTALVTLVDTDSFQVTDPETGYCYACPVRTPDFTPPESQGNAPDAVTLTTAHDLFALGVLIFHLLMEGTHPFAGVYEGEGDPPAFEERIAAGHFPYGSHPGPYHPSLRHAPSFGMLSPALQQLFLQCFEQGHSQPNLRPDARSWQRALDEAMQSLHCCGVNAQHFYSNHLSACPWCARKANQLRGIDPFPSEKEVLARNPVYTPTPIRAVTLVEGGASGYAPTPTTNYTPPTSSHKPRVGIPAGISISVGLIALFGILSQISTQPSISRPEVQVNSEQYLNPPTVNAPASEDSPVPTTSSTPADNTSPPTPTAGLSAHPAVSVEFDDARQSPGPSAVSSNGRYLAIASKGARDSDLVRIWDLNSSTWLSVQIQSTDLAALDFSADGSLLAIGDRTGVRVLRTASGLAQSTLETDAPVTALALSSDGSRIAYVTSRFLNGSLNASHSDILLMDFVGTNRHTQTQNMLKSDPDAIIKSLRFSPNGAWLAETRRIPNAPSTTPVRTTLWELASGKQVSLSDCSLDGLTFAFSPDSEQFAQGGSAVNLFKIETGELLKTYMHAGKLQGLRFSQDGQSLTALASTTLSSAFVYDWKLDDSSEKSPISIPDSVSEPFPVLLTDPDTVVSFKQTFSSVLVFRRTSNGSSFQQEAR